jgi:hypothetical protein
MLMDKTKINYVKTENRGLKEQDINGENETILNPHRANTSWPAIAFNTCRNSIIGYCGVLRTSQEFPS